MVMLEDIRRERLLLLLWLIINLSIGVLIVRQYGMSVDEPNNYRYADDTLDAYPSLFGILYEPKYDSAYDGHGPAFLTITLILIRLVQVVFPNAFVPDLWHFSYFVTFQLTGLCLYWLSKRWFSTWTSWGILILFTTQPLLWGHAFINPKDIPFMFFFTLSITLGFHMVDSLDAKDSIIASGELVRTLISKFQESSPRRKKRFFTYLGLSLAIALALFVFSQQINSLIVEIVTFFYTASSDSWAGRLFGSIAIHTSNMPVENYVTKVLRLFHRTERGTMIAGVVFFAAYFSFLISNITFPTLIHTLWKQLRGLLKTVTSWDSWKIWFAEFFRILRTPHIIFAGIALGLATAVRAIAPLAGVTVIIYLFIKVRSKAWITTIAYFLIAGIVTYLAWPHLWATPIQRYFESLGIASNFPWSGKVLFNNHFYLASKLPHSYLPVLLNIQLTLPFLLLFYVGFGFLIWHLLRDKVKTDLLLYIGFGSIFPLLGLIWLHSPLYDNFRQLLFLLPGFFPAAGLVLEGIINKLRQRVLRLALIVVICLPGLISLIRLQPYSYVYYNSLPGGVEQASRRFEMDYWRISMREIAFALNKTARPGAKVIVVGSLKTLTPYVRPDLILEQYKNATFNLNGDYDYAILPSRLNALEFYPEAKIVSSVQREGAVLAVIKSVKGERSK